MYILISIKTSDFDYKRKHPRLTQIAWNEISNDVILSSNFFIIKHIDYEIPWLESVETGFDNEKSIRLGVPFDYMYSRLKFSLKNCDLIIGFDLELIQETIGGELSEVNYNFEDVKQLCLKVCSTQYCGSKNSNKELIPPTLSELNEKLFGTFRISAKEYSAKEDLEIISYCLNQLNKLGIAKLWKNNEVIDYDLININLEKYIIFLKENLENLIRLNTLDVILYDKDYILQIIKEWLIVYNQFDEREKVFWRKSFTVIGETSFGNIYTDLLEKELSIFSTNYSPINYFWYKIPIASSLPKFQNVINEILFYNSVEKFKQKCIKIKIDNA